MLMKVKELVEPLQRLRAVVPDKCQDALEAAIGVLDMPIDQPELASALGTAVNCFLQYAKEIPHVRPHFSSLISDLEEIYQHILENRVGIQGLPPRGQLEGRYADFPVYALTLTLAEEQHPLHIAMGAEFALALLDQRQFSSEYATKLRRDAKKYGRPESEEERKIDDLADQNFGRPWLPKFKKIDQQVRRRVEMPDPNGPARPDHANPRHQLDLLARLKWRFEYADPKHRQGVLDDSHLSDYLYFKVVEKIKQKVEDGDPAALVEAVCVLFRLPPDLILSLPVKEPACRYWVLWLDIPRGVISLNFDSLFPNRKRPALDTAHLFQASEDTNEVPLPDFIVQQLQRLYLEVPQCRLLGDLVNWVRVDTTKSLVEDAECKLTPSLARASKTTGSIAITSGLDRINASCQTLDFSLSGSARAYYARLTGADIYEGSAKLYAEMNWGAPFIQKELLKAVGSHCVLTEAGAQLVFEQLKRSVTDSQPQRRSTLSTLVAHHNHYTRYCAAITSFCLGLREVKAYRLITEELVNGQSQIKSHDKQGGNVLMAQPVLLNSIVREQIQQYLAHCRALHARLSKYSDKEALILLSALTDILNSRGNLFIFATRKSVCPAGSNNTWNERPEELRVPGNVGRHFWQNMLRYALLGSRDIDRFMRHRVVGLENNTTSQAASPKASFDRIEKVQLKVLNRLGIEALSGLRKAKS